MHRFTPVLLAVFGVFSLVLVQLHTTPVASAAAANTVNFQARLQSASGAIVPDGTYNIEFKLYSGDTCRPTTGTGCTQEWTEHYLNSDGKGLSTINGYLSANLGSITAFPSTINWDQQLWLSMNVGGSTSSASWDGEMLPYLNLTAVPAAFSANQLANTTSFGRSTLTFQGSSSGDQNFIIQDQGAAGTYDLLTSIQASTGYTQLQTSPGTAQSGSINVSGMATADTVQGTTAVQTASIRPVTDSTTGIQVENAAGTVTVMDVDTTNYRIGIGTTAPSATLDIKGPTSDSSTNVLNVTNAAGGSIINARDDGQITFGTTAASGTPTTFGSMDTHTADTNDGNFFVSTKFTTGTHDGTLTSISVFINAIDSNPGNNKFRVAIYTDAGVNHPTTLIAQSAEGTAVAGTFNTLAVSASLTANTTYWLAYQTNGSNNFNFDSAGSNQYYAYANPYGAFPSTAGTGGGNGSVALAIYGTYTEAGTGTVPALTIAADGTVGIGNSSPAYALDVAGSGNFTGSVLSPQLDNSGTLSIGTNNATDITLGSTGSVSTLTLGQSTSSNTINVGNAAATGTQTINLGTGATGTGADVVSIGSYLNSSSTTIKGGTGNINLLTNNASTSVIAKSNVNTTAAFQVQNSSAAGLFTVDTSNNQVIIGPSGGDTNGTLVVLGNKTNSGDPTGVNGAMYYNSSMQEFRCYRDGSWAACGVNPIDRGYSVEDEFLGGSDNTDGAIGNAGWSRQAITSNAAITYNSSNTGMQASADHPGVLEMKTAATTNTGTTLTLSTNSSTGSVGLSPGQTVKTTVSVGNSGATTQTVRVGLHNQTTGTTAPTTGVYWEADPTASGNWRYCYNNTSTPTCASSGVAIAANSWVRLGITVNALGSGTSSVTFTINGTATTVSNVTINTTNLVNPAITIFSQANTSYYVDVDYYQFYGFASAAR